MRQAKHLVVLRQARQALPITAATAPPIPNPLVKHEDGHAVVSANTVLMASITRDSSPRTHTTSAEPVRPGGRQEVFHAVASGRSKSRLGRIRADRD